jgi:two-component system, OmpR family, phosphate regulon sensor histidine kinase PhoR
VRKRIFFRLLGAFLVVIAAATVTLDLTVRRAWEASLRQEIERDLRQKTVMFAGRVNSDRQHSAQDIAAQVGHAAGARATIIDAEGKVLADSEIDPATMENAAGEPEFAAALMGEVGASTHSSHAIGVPFLCVAAPISGGAVRLAYPLSDIAAATANVRRNGSAGGCG